MVRAFVRSGVLVEETHHVFKLEVVERVTAGVAREPDRLNPKLVVPIIQLASRQGYELSVPMEPVSVDVVCVHSGSTREVVPDGTYLYTVHTDNDILIRVGQASNIEDQEGGRSNTGDTIPTSGVERCLEEGAGSGSGSMRFDEFGE